MNEQLSIPMQNYLETVFELEQNGNGARVSDIAKKLGVSKASVCNAMEVLSSGGYVDDCRYRDVFLTESGRKIGQSLWLRHSTLKNFFTSVLGVDEPTADTDACAIEHVISDSVVDAMGKYLNK